MPRLSQPIPQPSWLNLAVNRIVLVAALGLAAVGFLRLLGALFNNDPLPLRPVDHWAMMGLRFLAVAFALGLLSLRALRRRYFLLLWALVLLTTAGLWLRLGSLLPKAWQPAAGFVQLLLSVLGLCLLAAGLALGEDLLAFFQEMWLNAGSRTPPFPPDQTG